MSRTETAQGLGLTSPITRVAGDVQRLLIEIHCVMDFAERRVRIAERDQVTRRSFVAIHLLCRIERRLAPPDPFARMLAQIEHVLAGVRIRIAEFACGTVRVNVRRCPYL